MKKSPIAVLAGLAFTSQAALAWGPGYTRVNAAAESAETAYTNPAGMTRFDEKTTSAGATLIKSFKEFNVDESRTTVSGSTSTDASDPVLIPSFYHIRPLNDKWRFGFSATLAAGFGADNGSSWAGRYYNDQFSLAFIDLTPSVAYPVNDRLSLGLAIPISISNSITTSQIPTPPGLPDGELEVESTEVAPSLNLSTLYEFSEKTRIALIYRAETDYDSDPDVKITRSSLPANVIDQIEDVIDSVEYNSNMPQSIAFGLLHELDNGWQISMDAVWVDFSEFGVTEISIRNQTVVAPDSNFNDIYAVSVGAQLPVKGDTTWRFGMLYVSSAVDDEDRTFSFALDRMFGVGVGMHRELGNGHAYNFNFNLIDTGEGPIDTGPDPVRGRVAGESDNHYAITLDFTYHWR